MGLTGQKKYEIEIRSDGDAFHKLFRHAPHELSNFSPNTVKGYNLHEGDLGSTGHVVLVNYVLDGKHQVGKNIVHVNEEKKVITYELIEGDLKELYKTFSFTVLVEEKDGGGCLVTWTVQYEKFNEEIPDPDALLQFFTTLTKDIEAGHVKE